MEAQKRQLDKEFILKGIVGEVTRNSIWERIQKINMERPQASPLTHQEARVLARYFHEFSRTPSLMAYCPQWGEKRNVFIDCKGCISEPEICQTPAESENIHKEFYNTLLSTSYGAENPKFADSYRGSLLHHYNFCKECQERFPNAQALVQHYEKWVQSDDAMEAREEAVRYQKEILPVVHAFLRAEFEVDEAERNFDFEQKRKKEKEEQK